MTIRILLVDDEPGLRVTLAANLELEGFDVIEADCGAQALAQLESHAVDVVLTDIRMPGMNGVELFQIIKRTYPDLPVVLSTAFTVEALVRNVMRDGAFTVLPKPSDVGHVVATVTRAAQRPFVLIVDDPVSAGASTVAALQGLGLRTRAAPSGEAAIALIASGEVDVCVVELLTTPGVSAIEQMRKLAPEVSVVAVSAHAVPELIQRAASAGAFACLRKPFDTRDLAQIVAEARGTRTG